ncbi:hypothetical protein CC80DRAFT_597977 [Byssothecium circinans]|uniref:Uncharacterized protein n=1 Tax=Byssothecium circinans TaxID=147558 RepID=A0A6A5TDM5_9PLEO|nr:hypothetical protein CC80DRAFT_597977 [Byssothecium circinans]
MEAVMIYIRVADVKTYVYCNTSNTQNRPTHNFNDQYTTSTVTDNLDGHAQLLRPRTILTPTSLEDENVAKVALAAFTDSNTSSDALLLQQRKAPDPTFRFMDLPQEIQDHVYHYLWTHIKKVSLAAGNGLRVRLVYDGAFYRRAGTSSKLPLWLLTNKAFFDKGLKQFCLKSKKWVLENPLHDSANKQPAPLTAGLNAAEHLEVVFPVKLGSHYQTHLSNRLANILQHNNKLTCLKLRYVFERGEHPTLEGSTLLVDLARVLEAKPTQLQHLELTMISCYYYLTHEVTDRIVLEVEKVGVEVVDKQGVCTFGEGISTFPHDWKMLFKKARKV